MQYNEDVTFDAGIKGLRLAALLHITRSTSNKLATKLYLSRRKFKVSEVLERLTNSQPYILLEHSNSDTNHPLERYRIGYISQTKAPWCPLVRFPAFILSIGGFTSTRHMHMPCTQVH